MKKINNVIYILAIAISISVTFAAKALSAVSSSSSSSASNVSAQVDAQSQAHANSSVSSSTSATSLPTPAANIPVQDVDDPQVNYPIYQAGRDNNDIFKKSDTDNSSLSKDDNKIAENNPISINDGDIDKIKEQVTKIENLQIKILNLYITSLIALAIVLALEIIILLRQAR